MNTEIDTTSWTPDFSVESLSTEIPVLPTGIYAGEITSATIQGKEKPFFTVQTKQKWNRSEKKMEDDLKDGEKQYVLRGAIGLSLNTLSKRALKILKVDSRGFYLLVNVNFDEKLQIDKQRNTQLRNLLDVLEISGEPTSYAPPFEYNEYIDVPDELADVPNIKMMLNVLDYWKSVFDVICRLMEGKKVGMNIEKQTKDKITSNVIANAGSSCGLLRYKEGSENDVVE